MSGLESSLSSPLTIPMATSSSVAADGGCIPTISTYTQKVKEKELKGEKRLLARHILMYGERALWLKGHVSLTRP